MPKLLAPSTRALAPYITTWSAEQALSAEVLTHPRLGITYADETLGDRDRYGVLWYRVPSRPGHGRPEFGMVHPLRQRRAMRKVLCQVCAGPADSTDDGVLWLLQDHRDDWPNWPERMGVTEPPICMPCVRTSVRLCPALRRGYVAVRARHFPIAGVHGALYAEGRRHPVVVGDATFTFDDPRIRWIRAASLVRELRDCTILSLDSSMIAM